LRFTQRSILLNSIRIFIKVVEVGSFSKAAAILNMAPSSIARSVDTLEDELGVTLLKRSTRQLILTEKGVAFFEGASQLLTDTNSLVFSLKDDNQEPEGLIRISVFESFGRIHIAPLLPTFLSEYPKIKVEIELENRMVDLDSENIDLAIRIGMPVDSGLKARMILSNHTLVCASPEYLIKHKEPKEPSDLSEHNCLLLNQGRQRTHWYFKKARKISKVHVRGNLSSKGGTPLLEAALNGTGIVMLSNWMVSDYVKEGRLVVCLQDWESSLNERTSGEVFAVYKNSKYPNPLIRLLLDYLLENLHKKTS